MHWILALSSPDRTDRTNYLSNGLCVNMCEVLACIMKWTLNWRIHEWCGVMMDDGVMSGFIYSLKMICLQYSWNIKRAVNSKPDQTLRSREKNLTSVQWVMYKKCEFVLMHIVTLFVMIDDMSGWWIRVSSRVFVQWAKYSQRKLETWRVNKFET